MNKVEISYNGREIRRELPSSWGELDRFHLMTLCHFLTSGMSPRAMAEGLAYRFMQAGHSIFFKMNEDQLAALVETLRFLFETPCELATFPLDTFRHRLRKLYSPGAKLQYSTIAEVSYADRRLQLYNAQEDDKELCKLIAAIYRPSNPWRKLIRFWNGTDRRVKFKKHQVERRARRLKSLPEVVKKAALLQFIGCRNVNVKEFSELHKSGEKDKLGWAGLIISLAGPEIGPLEKVEAMNWNNALIFMLKLENDRIRAEANFKKSQSA